MFPTTLDPLSEIDFETVTGLVLEGAPCPLFLTTARTGGFSMRTEATPSPATGDQPRIQMRQIGGTLHIQVRSETDPAPRDSYPLSIEGTVPEGVALAVRQAVGTITLKGTFSRIRTDCAQLNLTLTGATRELAVTGQNAALTVKGRIGNLAADLNSGAVKLKLPDMESSDRLQLKARVLAAKIGVPRSLDLAQDINANVLAFKSTVPQAAEAAASLKLHAKVLSGKVYPL